MASTISRSYYNTKFLLKYYSIKSSAETNHKMSNLVTKQLEQFIHVCDNLMLSVATPCEERQWQDS